MEIMIVCVVIALVVGTRFVTKAYAPKIKGHIGEWHVRMNVKRLGKRYKSYDDVYLTKRNGELTQVDHIVTSPFGIFVIETKNYRGVITGAENDTQWKQTFGSKTYPFYSPVFQNKAHVHALKHAIKEDVPIHSIVVFSDEATLKLPQFDAVAVIQMKQLRKYIKQYKQAVIAPNELANIDAMLHTLMSKPRAEKKQIKREHLQLVEEKVQQSQRTQPVSQAAQMKCPTCGKELVERKGKFGRFYGCSGFPTCRFTLK